MVSTLPDRSAAAISRSQAATETAIGFSSSTCLPASKAAMPISSWRWLGTTMSTASIVSSASSAETSWYIATSGKRSRAAAAVASLEQAMAASSAPGAFTIASA